MISAFFFLLALAVFFFQPEQAFAWGPGVHLLTGNWLLQNLAAVPGSLAPLLMQYPAPFLHGVLSADIFIGKGCKATEGHSHNWESGFSLLELASSPQERAYAFGYLSHLAADVVAHNVFVPGLFHTAPGKGKTAHVYLEIQADRLINWDSRDAIALFHRKGSPGVLSLLRSSMNRSALPFWINTQLFQGSMAIGGSSFWRGSMGYIDKLLYEQEREALVNNMLVYSTRAMFSLLREGRHSPVLALDPIGTDALAHASSQTGRCPGLTATLGRRLSQGLHRYLGINDRKRGPSEYSCNSPPMGRASASAFSLSVPDVLQSLPPACGQDKE